MRKVFVIVLFIIIFWVNIPAIFQPCNWQVQCPDYIRSDIVALHPNFYYPQVIGGIAGMTYPAHWSIRALVFDIKLFCILVLILTLVQKLWQKK